MVSLNNMVMKLHSLMDTNDLTEWEQQFMSSVLNQTQGGKDTGRLSEKQVSIIEQLHNRHFGD